MILRSLTSLLHLWVSLNRFLLEITSFLAQLSIQLLTTTSSSMFEKNWTKVYSYIGLGFNRGVVHGKMGYQARQDGLPGTNCPIPPKWNWIYQFQVNDQIGSFFYFPSLYFQRAASGFGGFIINNRDIIPIPFGFPNGDITILIGDWL